MGSFVDSESIVAITYPQDVFTVSINNHIDLYGQLSCGETGAKNLFCDPLILLDDGPPLHDGIVNYQLRIPLEYLINGEALVESIKFFCIIVTARTYQGICFSFSFNTSYLNKLKLKSPYSPQLSPIELFLMEIEGDKTYFRSIKANIRNKTELDGFENLHAFPPKHCKEETSIHFMLLK
ncbi:hypothetical protein RF11_13773 [Thelohanellus kitauei]|uniref:Uncharacterized protein n=1 Tax=Thelohanellus kitauei TaxID=669202 RepID=A0A0C2MYD5_THEKT|nr:hypothetical protein RF11_13773 [Thelohanellus kitauei]